MSEAKQLLKQLSAQQSGRAMVVPPSTQVITPQPSQVSVMPAPPKGRIEVMLPEPAAKARKRTWLRYAHWVIGFIIIGELLLPPGLKPMQILATPFKSFYIEMANVGVYSAEQQALAQMKAQAVMAEQMAKAQAAGQIEASRAQSKGSCGLLGLLSPEFGQACNGVVDSWHDQQKNSLQD